MDKAVSRSDVDLKKFIQYKLSSKWKVERTVYITIIFFNVNSISILHTNVARVRKLPII